METPRIYSRFFASLAHVRHRAFRACRLTSALTNLRRLPRNRQFSSTSVSYHMAQLCHFEFTAYFHENLANYELAAMRCQRVYFYVPVYYHATSVSRVKLRREMG